jgi:hypothetical protein
MRRKIEPNRQNGESTTKAIQTNTYAAALHQVISESLDSEEIGIG